MIIGSMNQPTTALSAPSAQSGAPLLDGAVRLSHWGLIHAQGADAASFLQGQLTQNVQGLLPGQARLAGFCSAKGRLQASFVLWRDEADGFWLACSADLLAATLKRLSMFVLRAKCKLSDASSQMALWGLAGATAQAAVGDLAVWRGVVQAGLTTLRLPGANGHWRALQMLAADAAMPQAPALEVAAWDWLEVHSGVVRVLAATADQFVPQMVNFELVGGVDFQKGCYPGQEVVARSQYRGTLKRRAMVFASSADLQPGQEVFHSDDPGQPAGLVALAARRPGGDSAALVEVKLAALNSGSLHAGSADGPLLRPGTLPYALPQDAG